MRRSRQPSRPDWWLDVLIVAVVVIGIWLAWLLWGPARGRGSSTTTTTTTTPAFDPSYYRRLLEATATPTLVTTTTLALQDAMPCKPVKALPCKPPSPAALYRDRIAWLARHPWRQVEGSCNWTNGMQTIVLHCGPAGTW